MNRYDIYKNTLLLHLATPKNVGYRIAKRDTQAYIEQFLTRSRFDRFGKLRCGTTSYQCGNACIPKSKKCLLTDSQLARIVEASEDQIVRLPIEQVLTFHPQTGKVLLSKKGDRTSVDLTAAEVARMRGVIFTHNHPNLGFPPNDPRSLGFSFSKDDLKVAALGKVAQMRAVSSGYRHVLKPPPSGWDSDFWRDRLLHNYDKHYDAVYQNSLTAIFTGKTSAALAEANFHHEVMRRVARESGMKYERVRRA